MPLPSMLRHRTYLQPTDYTRNIQQIISANATAEFNTIWQEHASSGRAYTLISDDLSHSLIKLQNDLEESNLFDDEILRRNVMSRAIPKSLLEQVGLETLMKRLPVNYAHSMFSSYLASVSCPSACWGGRIKAHSLVISDSFTCMVPMLVSSTSIPSFRTCIDKLEDRGSGRFWFWLLLYYNF